ncbi:MAG: hypothetical protein ABMA25_13655 [Ilumatobacteraceae bacterium]
MTERTVRFTESFFDRLEELLPSERGADGTPSITDFLSFDIPAIRDRLARDAIEATLTTAIPGVRACIGTGTLISGFVAYVVVDDHDVEVFALSFDTG